MQQKAYREIGPAYRFTAARLCQKRRSFAYPAIRLLNLTDNRKHLQLGALHLALMIDPDGLTGLVPLPLVYHPADRRCQLTAQLIPLSAREQLLPLRNVEKFRILFHTDFPVLVIIGELCESAVVHHPGFFLIRHHNLIACPAEFKRLRHIIEIKIRKQILSPRQIILRHHQQPVHRIDGLILGLVRPAQQDIGKIRLPAVHFSHIPGRIDDAVLRNADSSSHPDHPRLWVLLKNTQRLLQETAVADKNILMHIDFIFCIATSHPQIVRRAHGIRLPDADHIYVISRRNFQMLYVIPALFKIQLIIHAYNECDCVFSVLYRHDFLPHTSLLYCCKNAAIRSAPFPSTSLLIRSKLSALFPASFV